MKKIFSILLVVVVCCGLVVGCGKKEVISNTPKKEDAPQKQKEKQQEEKGDITNMTAEQIITEFKNAGFPVGNIIVYTEETDENEMLGRPNGYTSKINFPDTRLEQYDATDPAGGSVEVFDNEADATKRREYIDALGKEMSALSEYLYQYDNVLIRLSTELTPEQAGVYEAAFNCLKDGSELSFSE